MQSYFQERRLLQHAEEFWEIVPDLFVHSAHQADLPHGPGSVRAVTISSLYLQKHSRAQIYAVANG